MDPIDDVFGAMRTHTAVYCRIEGTAPWGVAFVRGRAARFGLVMHGGCWLTIDGGEPIPVDYLMRQSGGTWKVFDVMVEGISYVQTFKTQFDAPLRQKSIQQVATELRNGSMQAGQAPRGK